MPKGKRTYADACGIARGLDAVGDRWALMVVRELLLGPKRFGAIRAGLPGLSADVLTQRLRDLEAAGVVERSVLPPPASAQVYELTPAGQELEEVLMALGRWGGAHAAPPVDGCGMSFDSHILSLRTLFRPDIAGDLEARVELRLEGGSFRSRVAGGEVEIDPGDDPGADAVIETEAATLIAICHGHLALAEAEAAGGVEIEGDREVGTRFLTLFPLPESTTATTAATAATAATA